MGVVLLLFWLGSGIVSCYDGSAIWEGQVAGNWNLFADGAIVGGAMFDNQSHLVVVEVPGGSNLKFVDYDLDLTLTAEPHVVWEAESPDCHDEQMVVLSHLGGEVEQDVGGEAEQVALTDWSWPLQSTGWHPV